MIFKKILNLMVLVNLPYRKSLLIILIFELKEKSWVLVHCNLYEKSLRSKFPSIVHSEPTIICPVVHKGLLHANWNGLSGLKTAITNFNWARYEDIRWEISVNDKFCQNHFKNKAFMSISASHFNQISPHLLFLIWSS